MKYFKICGDPSGVVGEEVIKRYKQMYPQDRVVFFAYTSDVGMLEYEARWLEGEQSLIQGFLPKSLLHNLACPDKNAWVATLQQAIHWGADNSYVQVLNQLQEPKNSEKVASNPLPRSGSVSSLPDLAGSCLPPVADLPDAAPLNSSPVTRQLSNTVPKLVMPLAASYSIPPFLRRVQTADEEEMEVKLELATNKLQL